MPVPESSAFERTVALSPLGDGRYGGRVEPIWNGPVAPNGGVLAATMLRAAEAELGPQAPPARTLAAHFLEAPSAGAIDLRVEVLRQRKRVSACEVRMIQADKLVCQATILFSAPRPQAAELRREPPAFPPPDQVPPLDFAVIPQVPPVFSQLEIRPTAGGTPGSGEPQALTRGWIKLRDDDHPLDPARLCALSDLWWPAVFLVMPAPAPVPTIQLTVHLRTVAHAVLAPVFARFQTQLIAEGHLEETGELWSRDGDLLAESRQLALVPPSRRAVP